MTCPYCGGVGIYTHCCPEQGRTLRQPCKACRSAAVTGEPDCACFTGALLDEPGEPVSLQAYDLGDPKRYVVRENL